MRNIRVLMACAAIACGTTLVSQQGARAESLIPAFTGIVSLGGGLYSYNYTVDLSSLSEVVGGVNGSGEALSFLTMYDFNGMVSASVTGTNGIGAWTPEFDLLGDTGVNQVVPDDATKMNVTFDYSGLTQVGPKGAIFTFEITSTIGVTDGGNTWFTGQDTKVSTGKLQGNIGQEIGAAAVPELGTMPLLGGMLGLGGFALRRKRRAA